MIKSGWSGPSSKSPALPVTLQNNATAAGNGTTFAPKDASYVLTFEINGTSTSRTIIFEKAGPSGTFGAQVVFNENDPMKYGSQTTGGSNATPENWQVEVPAGYTFRARVSAVAGGNVSIKGWATVAG